MVTMDNATSETSWWKGRVDVSVSTRWLGNPAERLEPARQRYCLSGNSELNRKDPTQGRSALANCISRCPTACGCVTNPIGGSKHSWTSTADTAPLYHCAQ